MNLNEKDILQALYSKGLIKTWIRDNTEGWTLVSGLWSPFYIQLRKLPSYPDLLDAVGAALGAKIKTKGEKLLGIAMAGIPIAAAISLNHAMPLCYTRKLTGVKNIDQLRNFVGDYGEHSLVEGEIAEGDRFIAVDDIVTRFDSKLVAINQLLYEAEKRDLSIECRHVAVVIDRQQGAATVAKNNDIELHSMLKFKSNLPYLKNLMTPKEFAVISDYLDNPEKYQEETARAEVIASIS